MADLISVFTLELPVSSEVDAMLTRTDLGFLLSAYLTGPGRVQGICSGKVYGDDQTSEHRS